MSVFSAHAINAKCRAMYARLLNEQDYDALLGKSSVSQIAEYLKKESSYANLLQDFKETDVHRGQLEHIFKKSLYDDYQKLIDFSTGDYKLGLQALLLSFEIDDLKVVLGSLCTNKKTALKAEDLPFIQYYSEIDLDAILKADSMEALVTVLKNTRYYKILLPFVSEPTLNFLKLDSVLDNLDYKTKLETYKTKLSGASKTIAMTICKYKIDIENIIFIYRIKKLYQFPVGDIISSLIPYYYRISHRELIELSESKTHAKFLELLSKTHYKFLFPPDQESSWENNYAEFLYKMHRHNLRTHGGDIGVLLSYLFLKEFDIKNIITVIEGVRYALPKQKVADFLIGYQVKPYAS